MGRTHTRPLYSWAEGRLSRAGAVSDGHLHAWEYEPVSDASWSAEQGDRVRLWRTRRPDLAPLELWVGDEESVTQH